MTDLTTPISKEQIKKLRVGDEITISGRILTARDMAHRYLVRQKPSELIPILKNGVIYHCGPIVRRGAAGFSFISAGPTTSIRQEPYQADLINRYHISAIIGKGGMGEKTRQACVKHGVVYLNTVGGAAACLAQTVRKVHDVFCLEEFGVPEAMWLIEVEFFPAIVTIDTTGADLHQQIQKESAEARNKLLR